MLRTFLQRFLPTSGAMREIAALGGLRALAILLVIWHHLYRFGIAQGLQVGIVLLRYISGIGLVGVDLFFVLSGFLLFLPYARALLTGAQWPAARQFYLRRVLRIVPAYYAVLVVLVLLHQSLLLTPDALAPLFLMALLLHNLRADAAGIVAAINGPLWSLAVEWQFYLLLPWIADGLAKMVGPRGARRFAPMLALGLVLMSIVGLGGRVAVAIAHYAGGYHTVFDVPGLAGIALRLLNDKYLEVFALGMATSILYVLLVEQQRLSPRQRMLFGTSALAASLMGLIGCTLWAASVQRFSLVSATVQELPPQGSFYFVLGDWVFGLCFCLLLLAVFLEVPILRAFFALSPMRYIGIISYSLYLWHVPLLALLIPLFSSYPLFLLISIPLLLLVGTASYYLIERPFLHKKRLVPGGLRSSSALERGQRSSALQLLTAEKKDRMNNEGSI